jgi:hypothetical protein
MCAPPKLFVYPSRGQHTSLVSCSRATIESLAPPFSGERVASALRPRAGNAVQSFERRSSFGRRGVASRVRGRSDDLVR